MKSLTPEAASRPPPPQGGNTSGPAKPVPRCSLGQIGCPPVPLLIALLGAPWHAATAADLDLRIESCVSANAIQFDPIDQHVALDPGDQTRVQAEMEQRYPVIARDGFPVSRIILWQKKNGESLFITLLEHPDKPEESCFTATFVAARFTGIEALRRKYLRPEWQI